MIRQGLRVKILKGEHAGKYGVVVAKAPGAGNALIWNVAVEGKGQTREGEKNLAPAT